MSMETLDRLREARHRFFDSDLWYSFTSSRITMIAAFVAVSVILGAVFAPWISPYDPFDLAKIDLMDSQTPPVWMEDGDSRFILGTDDQGRDMLSAILHGSRISIWVGFASVAFSLVLGVGLGLLSGYVGGKLDAFIMRVAEIQLSFPAILIALLIDGVMRGILPPDMREQLAVTVLVLAIGISGWVQYARTVRGSTMVEKNKEYVQAARLIGIHPMMIMLRHILPNAMGHRYDPSRGRHHYRSDTVLPRRRRTGDRTVARHPDPHRQRLFVLRRMVDYHLPRRDPRHPGAVREFAGRLATRRPQSETSLIWHCLKYRIFGSNSRHGAAPWSPSTISHLRFPRARCWESSANPAQANR
jgi:peptide/nickel transport system permease protein